MIGMKLNDKAPNMSRFPIVEKLWEEGSSIKFSPQLDGRLLAPEGIVEIDDGKAVFPKILNAKLLASAIKHIIIVEQRLG